MAVWNLGSINVDHVYEVPSLPLSGETIASGIHRVGLGGKGANQSVAAARAGADTRHIGMTGAGDDWVLDRMAGLGVDVSHVGRAAALVTGHAIIMVDDGGENAIVVHAGANAAQSEAVIGDALAAASPGDTLLLQNETSHQAVAARLGQDRGLRVVYSAAPFSVTAVRAVLPYLSVLVLNAVEEAQLRAGLGTPDVPETIVTSGARGVRWERRDGETIERPAFAVQAVDTTGAGDCFVGALSAALDRGRDRASALRFASAAAALQVTRPGAADAMPDLAEIETFLAENA